MSSTQDLRDRTGRLLGRIQTDSSGRRQELRDHTGRLLGHYDSQQNQTRDYTGRLIGSGNLLTTLL